MKISNYIMFCQSIFFTHNHNFFINIVSTYSTISQIKAFLIQLIVNKITGD